MYRLAKRSDDKIVIQKRNLYFFWNDIRGRTKSIVNELEFSVEEILTFDDTQEAREYYKMHLYIPNYTYTELELLSSI